MTIFSSIKTLMQICQWSGLAPYSMNKTTMKWESNGNLIKLSLLIIIYNVIVFIGTLVFNETFINYKNSKIRVFLTALILSWTHVHALSALLEFLMKRHQHINLLNMFEHVDTLFKQHLNMHVDYSKLQKSCRQIIILWICEVLWFIISDSFWYIETKNPRIFPFMCSLTPSYMICKLSYFYSVLLANLVRENIDVMNRYVKSITKQNGYYICDTFIHESKTKRTNYTKNSQINLEPETLQLLMTVYYRLWDGTGTIRNLMTWSLVIGLSNEFFILMFDSYWLFQNLFLRTLHLSGFLVPVTFIVSAIINIFFITNNYRSAVGAVTNHLLHLST